VTESYRTDADYARERDAEDSLADLRERFFVPDGTLYMDGNSLGPLSEDAEAAVEHVLDEWREYAIQGWFDGDPSWWRYGERLGDRLAPLVGADPREVVVGNSTTVNVHTLVGTFFDPEPGREKILVDELNFPTDTYAVRAQLRQRGLDPDEHLVVVESDDGRTIDEDDIVAAMDDDVALAWLPSVLYRSGQLLDLERLARAADERDVLLGVDLAHSIGVVPHDLPGTGVDFAAWCHYKYLNAGPGAIAGLYVNREQFGATPALAGWWGHEKATQFEMNPTFTPASDAGAFQIGTIPVLAAAPLDGALDVFEETSIEAVREKSRNLTAYLVFLADELLDDFSVGSPRDPDRRGGHVALEHPDPEAIADELRERGVIVDYRPPNVIRVCPAPLYIGYEDVWHVVEILREIESDRTGT
jgi:kynureninase